MQKFYYISTLLDQYRSSYAASRNSKLLQGGGNNYKIQPIGYCHTIVNSICQMASGLGINRWRIKNPSNIIYVYSALLHYLQMFFLKNATLPMGIGTITQRGPVSISCNISSFVKLCSQTSSYIFVNQIICVDARYTR